MGNWFYKAAAENGLDIPNTDQLQSEGQRAENQAEQAQMGQEEQTLRKNPNDMSLDELIAEDPEIQNVVEWLNKMRASMTQMQNLTPMVPSAVENLEARLNRLGVSNLDNVPDVFALVKWFDSLKT